MTDFVALNISTPNPDNILRQKYEDKTAELKSWINSQSDLDFYQFMAIRVATRTASTLDYYRLFTLVAIQEFAVIYVLQRQGFVLDHEAIGKNWCDGKGLDASRHVATALSIFVSMEFYNAILNLRERGMYSWGVHQPGYVNTFWISAGMVLNLIVTLSAWFSSLLLLFLTEYPLDMLLNSLALAVYYADYKQLANWMELEYDDFIDQYYDTLLDKKCQKCTRCSRLWIQIVHFIGNRSYNSLYLLPIAMISPIYMLICY